MKSTEKTIRNILVKSVKSHSIENETKCTDIQLMFYPQVQDEQVLCKYALLIDFKRIKDLDFAEIAGIWYGKLQGFIEQFIAQLYNVILANEKIDYNNQRIIIQATKEEPTYNDLIAYLYNGGKFVRELKVSEFVAS